MGPFGSDDQHLKFFSTNNGDSCTKMVLFGVYNSRKAFVVEDVRARTRYHVPSLRQ